MAADGSWQPDPNDPERLRWRTDAGEWTDYVATGKTVSTDPVPAPAPAPAPAPVPTERKRRKWPWIVLACFVAIGVVGVVSESEDEQPRSATTTVAVVENDCNRKIGRARTLASSWRTEAEAALTGDTLAHDVAVLTYDQMQAANMDAYACILDEERYEEAGAWNDLALAAQSLHDDLTGRDGAQDEDLIAECGRLGERVVLYTTEDIPDAVARFDTAAKREDIAAMQSSYNHIGATIRTLRSTAATMEATGCPGLFPEAWAEIVGGQLEMEVGWEAAQEICRQDMAVALDFDC